MARCSKKGSQEEEEEEGVGSEGIHHCNNKCKATVVDSNLNPRFKYPL
jgi:hypothetical protein